MNVRRLNIRSTTMTTSLHASSANAPTYLQFLGTYNVLNCNCEYVANYIVTGKFQVYLLKSIHYQSRCEHTYCRDIHQFGYDHNVLIQFSMTAEMRQLFESYN